MRTLLLFSLLSVSCGLTAISLVVVRSSLRRQIRETLRADLVHSVATFQNIQSQRRDMLGREATLLADLPSLKALMTSDDSTTIQDAGSEFWHVSGSDVFALVDTRGVLVAFYSSGSGTEQTELSHQLQRLLDDRTGQRYLFGAHRLFEVARQPLYFGSKDTGVQLGTVIIGYEIDRKVIREVREASSADVVFYVDRSIASTSLDKDYSEAFRRRTDWLSPGSVQGQDTWLGGEHYLATRLPLSDSGYLDIQLIVLKSYDEASRFLMRLNRLLLGLELLVLLLGGAFAVYLSRMITYPLETLVAGALALGAGNFDYELRESGMQEIRELNNTFCYMRLQLQQNQHELIESARLATVGRMATSISHDMRHYLSAIYANAEFLGYNNATEDERAELLSEVHLAVQGMTEMIDSLLIFGRTGQSYHPAYESVPMLVERTLALIRNHPDARSVEFIIRPLPQLEAYVDPRTLERAIYNLLLNASQASRSTLMRPTVNISLIETSDQIQIRITDSGPGVPDSIRKSLFEPFVTEGKENGIGLGLTVAQRVAQDHGGQVILEQSQPGKTTFVLCLHKGRRPTPTVVVS
jgi:signal transduction histidine kinase